MKEEAIYNEAVKCLDKHAITPAPQRIVCLIDFAAQQTKEKDELIKGLREELTSLKTKIEELKYNSTQLIGDIDEAVKIHRPNNKCKSIEQAFRKGWIGGRWAIYFDIREILNQVETNKTE